MKEILILSVMLISLVYSILIKPRRSSQHNFEKYYIIIMFLILFFAQAIQETTGYNDIYVYKQSYESFAGWNYTSFFNKWNELKDPFFFFVGFIFLKIGASFEVFKICINAFFIFSTYKLVKEYSVKPSLSIMTFVAIGAYSFSFTGLRQVLAMAVLMFSFKYLVEKSLVKFVLLVLVASVFHSPAIIFLVAYFIYHMRQSVSSLICLSIGGLIVILNSRALVTFYLNFIYTNDLYESYLEKANGLSICGVIILASIFIFSLIFLYNKNWKTNFPKLTHLLLVSIVFRILSVVWFGEFFRLSMYFSVFDILLIPEACTTSIGRDNSMPSLKSFIVSVILCLYWLISI